MCFYAFLLMMLGIELQVRTKFMKETGIEILKQPPAILDVSTAPFLILRCDPAHILLCVSPSLCYMSLEGERQATQYLT